MLCSASGRSSYVLSDSFRSETNEAISQHWCCHVNGGVFEIEFSLPLHGIQNKLIIIHLAVGDLLGYKVSRISCYQFALSLVFALLKWTVYLFGELDVILETYLCDTRWKWKQSTIFRKLKTVCEIMIGSLQCQNYDTIIQAWHILRKFDGIHHHYVS